MTCAAITSPDYRAPRRRGSVTDHVSVSVECCSNRIHWHQSSAVAAAAACDDIIIYSVARLDTLDLQRCRSSLGLAV